MQSGSSMNIISTWLYLIGTPDRARKLRLRVDGLVSPPLDESFGEEPPQCPTTVLFGAAVSRALYANPYTRPALDAWDTGMVTKSDIRRYCLAVERGQYKGSVFTIGDESARSVFWQVYAASQASPLSRNLQQYILSQPT